MQRISDTFFAQFTNSVLEALTSGSKDYLGNVSLDITNTFRYDSEKYQVLETTQSEYTGGAHGNYFQYHNTWGLEQNKWIEMEDVLTKKQINNRGYNKFLKIKAYGIILYNYAIELINNGEFVALGVSVPGRASEGAINAGVKFDDMNGANISITFKSKDGMYLIDPTAKTMTLAIHFIVEKSLTTQ
jgi:hypothetical protein